MSLVYCTLLIRRHQHFCRAHLVVLYYDFLVWWALQLKSVKVQCLEFILGLGFVYISKTCGAIGVDLSINYVFTTHRLGFHCWVLQLEMCLKHALLPQLALEQGFWARKSVKSPGGHPYMTNSSLLINLKVSPPLKHEIKIKWRTKPKWMERFFQNHAVEILRCGKRLKQS